MSNADLMEQFEFCKKWGDAEQWDILGNKYLQRGYALNAGLCFKNADELRTALVKINGKKAELLHNLTIDGVVYLDVIVSSH